MQNRSPAASLLWLMLTAFGMENVAECVAAGEESSGQALPQVLTPAQAAEQVDVLFAAAWAEQQVIPAEPASDSEFLRRVYLDLAGRIPAIAEVRKFLASDDASRRGAEVERLLDSPAYVRNLTIVWRNALIPQAGSLPQFRSLIPGFEAWLWTHIARNTAYDRMVRELLTTSIDGSRSTAFVLNSPSSPEAFFVVREVLPENLATGTSRAFLGVRLDCAQCHDHPFDSWRQQQFWNLAAFYAGFQPERDMDNDELAAMRPALERTNVRSIRIPGSSEVVPAMFLTGKVPDWSGQQISSRQVLAEWVTAADNPWFARMAVNRLWAQFFGQGLVHPVDDFADNNPPSHPQVLNLLAEQLVAHDFDLQFLIRTITATNVYQRASRQTHASQADPEMFARAALRGMTPEQFFDSLAEAVGYYQPYRTDNPFVLDDSSVRGRFLELYRDEAESPLQRETTILQALAMMNGSFVAEATSIERSQMLRAVVDFPLMSDAERLETLFLATVSRLPLAEERSQFMEYLQSAEADSETSGESRNRRYSDIFWALLNSSEFLLNH